MSPPIRFASRAADRARALEANAKRAKNFIERPVGKKTVAAVVAKTGKKAPAAPAAPVEIDDCAMSANVSLHRDDEGESSIPSCALQQLVNLYLHAAKHRTRHVAMLWPASPRTLVLTHALASLVRWSQGDKLGVRGLIYPVLSNVFYPLNHIHLGRSDILRYAQNLAELGKSNPSVTRSLFEKDAYLFALASLKPDKMESYNPSIGELMPHFYAAPGFKAWASCEDKLLSRIGAKLTRRAHSRALAGNKAFVGAPRTAPDALFALDGRLTTGEMTKALKGMAECGPPEVVVVVATRHVRLQAKGWLATLTKFCLELEKAFPLNAPGVLVVTDEPHAAYSLKDEVWKLNNQRPEALKWKRRDEYTITGIPNAVKVDGLLPARLLEKRIPAPRELDTSIVDSEAAKVVNRLFRIAATVPGGRDSAGPVVEAAKYLTRLAAMPCGVDDLVRWLEGTDIEDRQRRTFSWSTYYAGLVQFDKSGVAGDQRKALLDCMAQGEQLYKNYRIATPFALLVASEIGHVAQTSKRHVLVAFTSPLYKRLAERFLESYEHFPSGMRFSDFQDRVRLVTTSRLDEALDQLNGAHLVLAGLDDEALRILMTDDRVPAHTSVLLTQRGGQYLRAVLKPLVERFPEFKPLKPRMESVLRKLQSLPDAPSVLSTGDLVLPSFRIELSALTTLESEASDPEAWTISLEGGSRVLRRPAHRVYVYDPASHQSTDRGFRSCEVQALEPGDKLFVMSAALRELVESVLKEAGVDISHDKSFEVALREYHGKVIAALEREVPVGSFVQKVREIRTRILRSEPKLEANLPTEQSMRQWVNLGQSADTAFDKLRPQAPLKEAHFEAFASALGFEQLERAYLWQRVIMPVRNARRVDGRQVSEIYAHMLLQPESALVHSKITRTTLKLMFDQARECLMTVEAVIPKHVEKKS